MTITAAGDFVGLAEPAEPGSWRQSYPARWAGNCRTIVGLGVAGRDGVHGAALGRASWARLGEAVECPTWRRVVDLPYWPALAVDAPSA